jgi:hypothetical protein
MEGAMKELGLGVVLLATGFGSAPAQDKCPDPFATLEGTYKCEGSCNYTATICALPDYADGIKRWRFINGSRVATTGVWTVSGAKTISFATPEGWGFNRASTDDCGATIAFEGTPKGAQWKKISNSASVCAGERKRNAR